MRRQIAGAAQVAIAAIGGALSVWWLLLVARQWAEEGYFPWDGGPDFGMGIAGMLIFAVAWIWSLVTSLSVIRAARNP